MPYTGVYAFIERSRPVLGKICIVGMAESRGAEGGGGGTEKEKAFSEYLSEVRISKEGLSRYM